MLQGLLPLERSRIPAEVIAGLTLAALGIPEVMGYATIAGMPVVTGLYTLVLPVLAFALLGSSRHLVVGADSATAAIMAAGLAGAAAVGSPQYVALAGMSALLAAGFLLLARVVRLGFLADFLSRTVLVGFLTGVGVSVAAGQLAGMLGVPAGKGGVVPQVWHVLGELDQTSLTTLAVAGSVLAVVLGLRLVDRRIPGALVAVVGAITVSWACSLSDHGVATLGHIAGGLPSLSWPGVAADQLLGLTGTALSIFFVMLTQSAATSRAYAARYEEELDENEDIVALGAASAAAGLSGTFVVNGSPTKTQIVDGAGGRSQLAQLSTAALVVIVLLFLTGPLQYLPKAVLAAVVFLIGVELVDVAGMARIFRMSLEEFVVAAATAVVVCAVGVEQGIVTALVLSVVAHLRHSYEPRDTVLAADQDGRLRTQPLATHAQLAPGLAVYRFGASLYYANSNRFLDEALAEASDGVRWLCVDAAAVGYVDCTGGDTLRSLHDRLSDRGVRLVLCDASDDVRHDLDRYGISPLIGDDGWFATVSDTLAAYRGAVTRSG